MPKDNFADLKKLHELHKKNTEEARLRSSNKKLAIDISKRIRTTMIGAIAELERSRFGELFGFGKTNLTDKEREWKQIWDEVRTNILNLGNNQIREAQGTIEQYETKFKPYKTDFIVRRPQDD